MHMHENRTGPQPQEHKLESVINRHHQNMLKTTARLTHMNFVMHQQPVICVDAGGGKVPDAELIPVGVDEG